MPEPTTPSSCTGIEALLDLTRELREEQITLVVARLRTRMRPDFDAAGLTTAIGPEHLYPSVGLAVAAFPRPDVDGTSLS